MPEFPQQVVVNTTPIISLALINRLAFCTKFMVEFSFPQRFELRC
jgi:hypothetical protein